MRLSGTKTGAVNQYRGLGNQLWDLAGNRPSLDLPFSDTKSLVDSTTGKTLVDHTRASSGTYVDGDGLIKTATTNEPRFDHDPTTGESLGLLVEESRTNLLVKSEEFDDASWAWTGILPFGSGSISNATIAPDGYTTADLITENTSTGNHDVRQSGPFVSGHTYTWSVFFKAANGTRNLEIILSTAAFPGNPFVVVNSTTGAIIDSSDIDAKSQAYPNGWYRLSFSATADATATNQTYFRLVNGASDNYAGDGTSGIYIWGAQAEEGSFPTSYIPTEGSAVTRAADVASISGSNFSSWYRQDEGTMFADSQRPALPAASEFPQVFYVSDGAADNTLNLGYITSSVSQFRVRRLAFNEANLTPGASTLRRVTAGAYAANDAAVSETGSPVLVDTSVVLPSTLNQLNIGSAQAGASPLNGTIRRLTYWPTRLPNEVLQAITL